MVDLRWYLFLLALMPSLASTLCVAYARGRALRQRAGGGAVGVYGATLLLQHAGIASLMAAVAPALWLLGQRSAIAAAVAAGGLTGLIGLVTALDATLFVASGFRLEIRLGGLALAVHDFAQARTWRRLLGTLVAVAGAVAALSALETLRASAQTAPGASAWWLLAAAVLLVVQGFVGRHVPMAFCYEWNNLLAGLLEMGWHHLRARWQLRHDRGAVVASELLASHGEFSAPAADSRYPLLRTPHRFVGPTHFELPQPGERPHVVLLFLESFGAREVGALGGRHGITPHFDALSQQGVLWRQFYANGTITSRAAYASLFGVLPHPQQFSTQNSAAPPPVIGLPEIMRNAGYRTAYFHDGPIEWENARRFFLSHGFDQVFGQEALLHAYADAPRSSWSFDDRYLFKHHAQWLARQDAQGQPTFSTLFTITNHFPFVAPEHAPHPQTDVPRNSVYGAHLRTFQYTDACLGEYMRSLQEQGLAEKTMFLILGDHGQERNIDGADFSWSGNYSDGAVRIPLLLLAPGRIAPQTIDEVGSQVDLLPTVLDLLDLHVPHHSVGTSLKRRNTQRHAITSHPFQPSFLSVRFGTQRFIHSYDTDRAALYDLATDPGERQDLSRTQPTTIEHYRREVWRLRRDLIHLYNGHLAPPRPPRSAVPRDPPFPWPDTYESLSTLASAQRQAADAPLRQHLDLLALIHASDLTMEQKLEVARSLLRGIYEPIMGLMDDAERAATQQAARLFLQAVKASKEVKDMVRRLVQPLT